MSGRDRNAPCPCGSGKKYKKCCLAQAAEPEGRFTEADRGNARARLEAALGEAGVGLSLGRVADEMLWARLGPVDALPEGVAETGLAWRLDWIARQRRDAGQSLAGALASDAEVGTPGVRAYLRALDTTPVRVYEVGQVHPGSGLTLWDALNDRELRVFDPALSRTVESGWFIAGRVLAVGPSGRTELDGWPLAFPAAAEPFIDAFLDDVRAAAAERLPGTPAGAPALDEALRRMALLLFEPWARACQAMARGADAPEARSRPVGLTTTDGDPMVPTQVFFDVRPGAVDDVRAALAREATLEPVGEAWAWLAPGVEPGTPVAAIGRVAFVDGALMLECLSERRAARGRDLLEGLCGGFVVYRETQTRSIQALLEASRTDDGTPLSAAVSAAVQARVARR